MGVAERIARKLNEALSPQRLVVTDESHLHAGHAGSRPGGESHFRLLIVAAAFEGLSRVDRQRAVNRVLEQELAGPVHALAMRTLSPQEAERDEATP